MGTCLSKTTYEGKCWAHVKQRPTRMGADGKRSREGEGNERPSALPPTLHLALLNRGQRSTTALTGQSACEAPPSGEEWPVSGREVVRQHGNPARFSDKIVPAQ